MTPILETVEDPSIDARWQRWQARNARQDRRIELWFRGVAVLLFALAGAWLLIQVWASRGQTLERAPGTSPRAEAQR